MKPLKSYEIVDGKEPKTNTMQLNVTTNKTPNPKMI
jgi:hypothetical protein